ncbi:peptide ABC transporter permease [Hankyongella ginsenosidimutans]|uniref:Peptide ABC transporter permease n=1 Tax=Hankyongella ginsenosidimutans TaxID=1763828 RepID=A0A4D7C8R4_9SPHN|nr:SapC family protein [Hankyongella ginsenosidimutans]QCI79163.1 peptide ABC transporter permease [Hankyongella ginsenosidimutans]
MARNVLLNNVEHADLRVAMRHGPEHGDALNQVPVFPTEFADVSREYPILFRKDAQGSLQAVALLGLDRDENLFLGPDGWQARYIPAVQRRGPFLIGFQDVGGTREPMVLIDLDDPRVGDGEPLFLPQGGNTPFLDMVSRTLKALHQGVEVMPQMFAAFEAEGLIEPIQLELKVGSERSYLLGDVYTISESRLAGLPGAALERLNRAGFLGAAFLVLASMPNIAALVERKSRRLASTVP